MNLQELYASIGGDYEQALRTLRIDKLIDKHIRKLTKNDVVDGLLEAGRVMDAERLFEAAHAMKGVCGNLGLPALSEAASAIAEEYRPGNPRTMTDDQVRDKLGEIEAIYDKTAEGIRRYEEG